MPKFIFLDLETTGLDAMVDQVTEIAWVQENDITYQNFVKHDQLPNAWVLHNTDYIQRIVPAVKLEFRDVLMALARACAALERPYLVGACPAFDDRFLRLGFARHKSWLNAGLGHGHEFSETPYHYHILDVEALAMGALGHDEPCSLKDLRAALGLPGENLAPHSALADAQEVKIIFDALRARKEVLTRPVAK